MPYTRLCILDLDHTLIYGSYAPHEKTALLFEYNAYLKVCKRPFAEGFIDFLNHYYTHIIVYTTAKEDYANRIGNCKVSFSLVSMFFFFYEVNISLTITN